MTHQEKIIVSAYTGYLMCNFSDVHRYIEEKLGRPVWTHEMADPKIRHEICNAAREDFLALCKEGAEEGDK